MTKEPKLQVNDGFNTSLNGLKAFVKCIVLMQGARRIVTEWPDLDFEARRFTAKILGEDVEELNEPVAAASTDKTDPAPSSDDISEDSEQDLESKAEL